MLHMSGLVKQREVISATTARLTGPAGREIKETVTITPPSNDPFAITGVHAEKGSHIRHALSEIPGEDGMSYRLTIYNTLKEPGWYMDYVFVRTDSRLTPEFEIRVLGVIREGG